MSETPPPEKSSDAPCSEKPVPGRKRTIKAHSVKKGKEGKTWIWAIVIIALFLLSKGASDWGARTKSPGIVSPGKSLVEKQASLPAFLPNPCDDNPSSAACRKREECKERCKAEESEMTKDDHPAVFGGDELRRFVSPPDSRGTMRRATCLEACMGPQDPPQELDLRDIAPGGIRSLLRELDKLGPEQTTGE